MLFRDLSLSDESENAIDFSHDGNMWNEDNKIDIWLNWSFVQLRIWEGYTWMGESRTILH